MDISLRHMHVQKQAAWQRPLVAALQGVLHDTPLGAWWFAQLATKQVGGWVGGP